jgi:EAL domain-containing protein (putative c-di-GMP-specific phosphodiesterase class I)/CheY-like chemotaxis protein
MAGANLEMQVTSSRSRTSIEPRQLRQAVDNDELVLHYQPLVSLSRRNVVGMEALVRWEHPQLGHLGPDAFVPLAEQSGEIARMGAWVIQRACSQAAHWSRAANADFLFFVSANVSPRQLTPDLVTVVTDALATTGCPPDALIIELTETSAMAEPELTRQVLRELDSLGVRAIVDDFGTGYSSLAYLRRIPLHAIKIDRTFIDGLGREVEDSAIVAAVVSMAHALGRWVLAEGVETRSQLEHLRALGCEMAQGFYFGRPLPSEQATDVVGDAACGRWRPVQEDPVDDPRPAAPVSPVVLVVDDSDDVRLLLRTALTASGFRVYEASNGRQALELAASERPDCVLLDLEMPGMSGLEVVGRLRSGGESDLAILMLTASATPTARARAYALGADDFIVKPIGPRELVERVHRVLRDRGAQWRRRNQAGEPET